MQRHGNNNRRNYPRKNELNSFQNDISELKKKNDNILEKVTKQTEILTTIKKNTEKSNDENDKNNEEKQDKNDENKKQITINSKVNVTQIISKENENLTSTLYFDKNIPVIVENNERYSNIFDYSITCNEPKGYFKLYSLNDDLIAFENNYPVIRKTIEIDTELFNTQKIHIIVQKILDTFPINLRNLHEFPEIQKRFTDNIVKSVPKDNYKVKWYNITEKMKNLFMNVNNTLEIIDNLVKKYNNRSFDNFVVKMKNNNYSDILNNFQMIDKHFDYNEIRIDNIPGISPTITVSTEEKEYTPEIKKSKIPEINRDVYNVTVVDKDFPNNFDDFKDIQINKEILETSVKKVMDAVKVSDTNISVSLRLFSIHDINKLIDIATKLTPGTIDYDYCLFLIYFVAYQIDANKYTSDLFNSDKEIYHYLFNNIYICKKGVIDVFDKIIENKWDYIPIDEKCLGHIDLPGYKYNLIVKYTIDDYIRQDKTIKMKELNKDTKSFVTNTELKSLNSENKFVSKTEMNELRSNKKLDSINFKDLKTNNFVSKNTMEMLQKVPREFPTISEFTDINIKPLEYNTLDKFNSDITQIDINTPDKFNSETPEYNDNKLTEMSEINVTPFEYNDYSVKKVDFPETIENIPESTEIAPRNIPETPRIISESIENIPENIPKTIENVSEAPRNIPEASRTISETIEKAPRNIPEAPRNIPETIENVSEASRNIQEAPKNIPEVSRTISENIENIPETPRNIPENIPENISETPRTIPETPRNIPETPRTIQETPKINKNQTKKITQSKTKITIEIPRKPDYSLIKSVVKKYKSKKNN